MRKNISNITWLFTMLAIAWIVVLFVFSMQPATESGALSEGLTQKLFGWLISLGANADTLEHIVRKLAHFGEFALSGFFTGMALFSQFKRPTALFTAIGLEAVIAILNELSQLIPEGRACSAKDMLIDFSGAILGILIAMLINHRRELKKGKA